MSRVGDRIDALRATAVPILQCAVGAAVAWLVATGVIGHTRPFFAPIAAIIALGVGVKASARFDEALSVAVDTTRSVPPRWGARGRVAELAAAGPHVDLAVRDVRVIARGVVRAVDLEAHVPPEVPSALEHLARGVASLGAGMERHESLDAARREILHAAGLATLALERTSNMSVSAIVAQVRATAVDLLRGLGADRGSALEAVRSAAAGLERG